MDEVALELGRVPQAGTLPVQPARAGTLRTKTESGFVFIRVTQKLPESGGPELS